MSVLLIAEHNNKELKSFTLNAVTAASQIDRRCSCTSDWE
jgi:electron transfer flavoprotein alpha subunit